MWGAARGVVVASALTYLVLYAFPPNHTSRLPHSIAAFDFLLLLAFVAGTRLLARTLIERPRAGIVARGREVLIVGAGAAGQLIVREMQRNRQLAFTPIGFVDDDPRKRGTRIVDVKVLGTTDDLPHLLRDNKPDEVLIVLLCAGRSPRDIESCRAGARARIPGLNELISGDLNLAGRSALSRWKTLTASRSSSTRGCVRVREGPRRDGDRSCGVTARTVPPACAARAGRRLRRQREPLLLRSNASPRGARLPGGECRAADCSDRVRMRAFERHHLQASSTPPRTSTS